MTRTLLIGMTICLSIASTGSGDTEVKTLVHEGRTRSYRVHLPPSYRQGSPTALVFALHRHGGTAARFESKTGFSQLADREGFIVVYPDAVAYGPNQRQMWNGGGIFGRWWAGQVDDVSFFTELIDTVSEQYTTDPNRLFVFGESSGAFMAYHLAARLPGRFAAIAPWAGLLAYDDSIAGPPLSVIHFHGARDRDVLYTGMREWGFYGVERGLRLWAQHNGCKSTPTVISDDPNTLVRKWTAPAGEGDIILYKLKHQDHSYPALSTCNLPEIAWDFFENHPRIMVKEQDRK